MIANWIHITLVHIAVIGTPWMTYRVFSHRQDPMDSSTWKNTYSWLIILAAITGVSYYTGPDTAEWAKETLVAYPLEQVENHGLWGRVAMVLQVIIGLLGIMGWASIFQEEKPDRRISSILIVLLLINTLIIIYTAHLGGLIRRMDLIQ